MPLVFHVRRGRQGFAGRRKHTTSSENLRSKRTRAGALVKHIRDPFQCHSDTCKTNRVDGNPSFSRRPVTFADKTKTHFLSRPPKSNRRPSIHYGHRNRQYATTRNFRSQLVSPTWLYVSSQKTIAKYCSELYPPLCTSRWASFISEPGLILSTRR